MNGIETWLNQYFDEVDAKEFYRDVFPLGELEKTGFLGETGKYTGIIAAISKAQRRQKKKKVKSKDGTYKWELQFMADGSPMMEPVTQRYYLTDELTILDKLTVSEDLFCLMSPISYAGRQRSAVNARNMYALAFDLDFIRMDNDGLPVGLMNFWNGHVNLAERLPKPTYMVFSGSGVHLYYVFEQPVPLFSNVVKQLQKLKHELTWKIWNDGIVSIKNEKEIQFEGIYQGFRLPGTITKNGGRARAFLCGKKVTIEYLNNFVEPENQVTEFAYKSELHLSEAKELYPEWYDERIVKGMKGILHPWAVNRRLYDWWKRQILNRATVGHRYNCLMTLAAYAYKCSFYDPKKNPDPVNYEELESDAFEIMNYFETLTVNEDNHFTEYDVLKALESFNDGMLTYPRNSVEYKAGFDLPKNKRNYQKQCWHLEEARAIRDLRQKRKGTNWRNEKGRPVGSGTKEKIVKEWRQEHPKGKKAACIQETGLSKKTVYKWWE